MTGIVRLYREELNKSLNNEEGSGTDLYTKVASRCFAVSPEDVTPGQRNVIKRALHSYVYGCGLSTGGRIYGKTLTKCIVDEYHDISECSGT